MADEGTGRGFGLIARLAAIEPREQGLGGRGDASLVAEEEEPP